MKAIIFARVSDKKQDSNEAQVTRISDYIKAKGLTPWKTYEIEESSTKGDRERFQEAIRDIEQSKEPVALVADTVDRLQRSFRESVLLDDLRRAGKLEIHFYREGLIVNQNSNSSELLRWDMAVMFARSYVLQLSDNVKRKYEQMRRNGEWTGKPPIGYKSVYDSDGKRIDIILNLDVAHFIQKMFELYATGNFSLKKVREEITKAGLLSQVGTPIATSMIEHILKNPFYYGVARSKRGTYSHKYLPLITKQLFDQCQQVANGWGKQPFQYAAKPYIFRGLLRCARCGCSMSPETSKGHIYYACSNGKKTCKRIYVREGDLLKPVYGILRAFETLPQERIDEVVEGLKQSHESKQAYQSHVIMGVRKEYDDLQRKADRLLDLLVEGSITTDDRDKKLKEIKARQQELNILMEEHTEADGSYHIAASTVLNLIKRAKEIFDSSEVLEKRALLNFLLQNSTVDGKTPAFSLRSPFDTILSFANQPTGLRGEGGFGAA